MEASIIVEIINSVGFPIGMCVALFWFCNKKSVRITLTDE